MKTRVAYHTLLAVATAAMLFAVGTIVAGADKLSRSAVDEQFSANGKTLAVELKQTFERAMYYGISLQEMVGVPEYFSDVLRSHKNVAFIALKTRQGEMTVVEQPALGDRHQQIVDLLYLYEVTRDRSSGDFNITELQIGGPGIPHGKVFVAYEAKKIYQQGVSVSVDLLIAGFVAFVIVSELMKQLNWRYGVVPLISLHNLLISIVDRDLSRVHSNGGNSVFPVIGEALTSRLGEVQRKYVEGLNAATESARSAWLRIGDKYHLNHNTSSAELARLQVHIRLVVFLMAMSEELSRPFIAVFVTEELKGAPSLSGWVGPLLIGAPLSCYWFFFALSQILGPKLQGVVGVRKSVLAAGMLSVVGLIIAAMSRDWGTVLGARLLSATGFGILLILAQIVLLRAGTPADRLRSMASIAGAQVAAGICGPLLGGLIADYAGYAAGFYACASLAAIATVVCWIGMPRESTSVQRSGQGTMRGAFRSVMRLPAAWGLVFLHAIPAKIVATAVLLVVAPLSVAEAGDSLATAGKVVLLYFVGYFIGSGVAARLSATTRTPARVFPYATLLTIGACCIAWYYPGIVGMATGCFLLGLAQAPMTPVQTTYYFSLLCAPGDPSTAETALGLFRLLERLGAALGPVIAIFSVQQIGMQGTMLLLGGLILHTSLSYLAIVSIYRKSPEFHEGVAK